jgi:hypothetical protein
VSAQRGCTVNKHQDTWELYYLPEDFSHARNIGAEYPDKLAELIKCSLRALLLDHLDRHGRPVRRLGGIDATRSLRACRAAYRPSTATSCPTDQ